MLSVIMPSGVAPFVTGIVFIDFRNLLKRKIFIITDPTQKR
jgi:hypothetical protein